MPLQNRVDPWGRLQAVAQRGAWMGNRGVLHDRSRSIVTPWRLKRWITCVLSFRGRKREVFAPNRYTELFFLDEATSLAAGHRPCAECRRGRYEQFREAWAEAHRAARLPSADEIDLVLHRQRLAAGGAKRTWHTPLGTLPEGAFVELEGRAFLYHRRRLLPWRFSGYGEAIRVSPFSRVSVLTPKSLVGTMRTGFAPQVHSSAHDRT